MEFLPVSSANAQALFGAFVGELDRAGAMAADFYGYHGETRKLATGDGIQGAAVSSRWRMLCLRAFSRLMAKGGGIMSAIFLRDAKTPTAG